MADQIQGVPAGLTEQPLQIDQTATALPSIQGVPAGLKEEPVTDYLGGGATQPPESANPLKMMQGAGKEALKTGVGAVELANKIPGSPTKLIPQDLIEKGKQLSETHGLMEGAGGLLEQGAEWGAGEEGLKALTSLAKIAHYAPEVMKIIEDFPTASKTILGMVKGAAIGGAQGGVKGAAEGKAAEGAEAGAVGGAIGAGAGELGGEVLGTLGKKTGVTLNSAELAKKAAKPGKWNVGWDEAWEKAAPRLADQHAINPVKGVKDVADAALQASDDLWNKEVKPTIAVHEHDLKDVQPVADAIRSRITPSLTKYSPEKAKAIEEFANKFAGPGPKSMMSIGEMENDIEHLNADLRTNGWWKKDAAEREAAIKSGHEDGMKALAADELRNQVYDHIDQFPGSNIKELKKTYGALRNVEHEFRGQVNVQGRQSTISLKKLIGGTVGAATGGVPGAVAAALPWLDEVINSPDASASRAVKAAYKAKKGASATAKAAKAVGGKVADIAPGLAGEKAAEWIKFKGGDGKTYEVHPEDFPKVQTVDPKAEVLK